jgi:hypothetical protein
MRITSLKSQGKVGLYLLLPLVCILTPTSWLEGRPSICLIRKLFGVSCPGCGMTRAISCVFHANFKKAFEYNKLVVIVFPLLCYLWLRAITPIVCGVLAGFAESITGGIAIGHHLVRGRSGV